MTKEETEFRKWLSKQADILEAVKLYKDGAIEERPLVGVRELNVDDVSYRLYYAPDADKWEMWWLDPEKGPVLLGHLACMEDFEPLVMTAHQIGATGEAMKDSLMGLCYAAVSVHVATSNIGEA